MVAFAEEALSQPHRRVLELIATGQAGAAAWCRVYPRSTALSAKASASRLMARPEARRYIAELTGAAATNALLTLQRKRALLRDFALDESLSIRDRIRAIELDAKLAGELAPKRFEHDVAEHSALGRILAEIRGCEPVAGGPSALG